MNLDLTELRTAIAGAPALERRANQCANALRARGVAAGDAVGLYLLGGTACAEATIGCLAIHAVPFDVEACEAVDALHAQLDGAGAVAVIHHRRFASRLAAARARLPKLRVLLSIDDGSGADLSGAGSEDFDSALAGANPDRNAFEGRSGTS